MSKGITCPHCGAENPISTLFCLKCSGKLDYSTLNIFYMLFVMVIIQAQPGDHRDWETIRAWAASLRPALLGEERTG